MVVYDRRAQPVDLLVFSRRELRVLTIEVTLPAF
jgi:hypothetical protein